MNEADKRLELGIFPVTDVRLGSATGYDDGVVTVDADGLRDALLEDIRLDDVQFDVIHPGDMVRVTTVRDQVEPRVKVTDRASYIQDLTDGLLTSSVRAALTSFEACRYSKCQTPCGTRATTGTWRPTSTCSGRVARQYRSARCTTCA